MNMKNNHPKTILIIEDDINTLQTFADALESEGFTAISAEDGTEGIKKSQEYLPDLIISDIIMSDIDGYGVLTALRADPLTAIIPFIFLTGSDTKQDVRKGMESGADDYLTKPITVDELLRAIAIRLQKQALIKQWYATQQEKVSQSQPENMSTSNMTESFFPSCPQLKEVFEYIEANYHKGITLCDVAEAVGYSSAYLTNRVAKQTGDTVNAWIVKRRMAAARSLLQNSEHTIERIAIALGYQNPCHFSRQFRQHHGVPPQTWRKENFIPPQKMDITYNMPTVEFA